MYSLDYLWLHRAVLGHLQTLRPAHGHLEQQLYGGRGNQEELHVAERGTRQGERAGQCGGAEGGVLKEMGGGEPCEVAQ